MKNNNELIHPPMRLAMPDCAEPTSYSLTKDFHIRASDIVEAIMGRLNKKCTKLNMEELRPKVHDVPGTWFEGPF